MSRTVITPLFIAEVSVNHLGNLNRQYRLSKQKQESGANTVKFSQPKFIT